MDKYRIDSHKLAYHVSRVGDWLEDKLVYPVYMEVSPAGACNHRCTYCGLDFMEYQKRFLETSMFLDRLSEMGELGLKSIMYAGEGEPFLHRDIEKIIKHTKASGIDVALTTNGVLLDEGIARNILSDVEWIKVSINGATPDTYAKIHRSKPSDFDKVIKNMSAAAKLKRENGLKCTLGMQLLLLPENMDEVVLLAEIARDIGMDYLVVKPYSQHPQSNTNMYKDIKYDQFMHLSEEVSKVSTSTFSIIFRVNTMKKWDEKNREYRRCLALPFWSYIDSGGNVWGCSVFLNDEKFHYGNIYETTFKEIWEGQRRLDSLRWVEESHDTAGCRVNCRMDEVNRYLWDIKNPPAHVNFI